MYRRKLVAALFVACSVSGEAADRTASGGIATQMNPAGLRFEFGGALRWSLSDSPSALVKDAHLALGFQEQLSPAYNRLGVFVEVSPLSILDLRAGVDGVGYFGTFGFLVGFPSYGSDFSDDARDAVRDQAVGRVGARFYLSPTLKLKAGRVSARLGADFDWWRVHDAPRGYFLEPYRGTLLDADGDSLVAGANVLLIDVSASGTGRVQMGAYHEYLEVYAAHENRRQRVGPMVAISLGKRWLHLRNPVLYVSALWYLEAPDRSGFSGFLVLQFGK